MNGQQFEWDAEGKYLNKANNWLYQLEVVEQVKCAQEVKMTSHRTDQASVSLKYALTSLKFANNTCFTKRCNCP